MKELNNSCKLAILFIILIVPVVLFHIYILKPCIKEIKNYFLFLSGAFFLLYPAYMEFMKFGTNKLSRKLKDLAIKQLTKYEL